MGTQVKMATPSSITIKGRRARKEPIAYNEMALRSNAAILDYCRTSMCALSGATAGIIGLTSLYGFVFYFVTSLMLSMFLLLKAGSKWDLYFISRTPVLTNGLLGGLFTYILFWTFLYGMVHVY